MPSPDATTADAYEAVRLNFASFDVRPVPGEEQVPQRVEKAVDAACVLLGSSQFSARPVADQVGIIKMVHDTLMGRPGPNLPIVAELGLRRFAAMLAVDDLTEQQVCTVYDALHGLYFAGITDVRELRRFDRIVPPTERWFAAHAERMGRNGVVSPDGPVTIAYLMHVGHLDRGNAVTPLILSLARMHAQQNPRRVIVYLVEYAAPAFEALLAEHGLTFRSFPQYGSYHRIDEVAAQLQADGVDVVITEQNRAIAAALFARRVAPLQMWLDTGFPFWSLASLDWTIAPGRSSDVESDRISPIVWRQTADTLKREVDAQAIADLRASFPKSAFVLGVFVRLVKLNATFLEFLGRLLEANPRFHLVIAGPGETQAIDAFRGAPHRAGRVTFAPGNVDLSLYGPAIDLMCDTFPFIGGNACREVTAHGTPVVSKLGTPWDGVLKADRNPDLLAATEDAYIALVDRLATDPTFLARQREVALSLAAAYVDPVAMIEDVERAIAAAAHLRTG